MFHDLTKGQKRALREAATLAHHRDTAMPIEDRDVEYLESSNADLPLVIAAAVVNGFLREGEVGEPARQLVSEIVATIRSIRERIEAEPVVKPPDPFDPDAPVSVAAILELVDLLSDMSAIYVNQKTGETIILDEDEFPMDEDELEEGAEKDDDDLPQWQQDSMRKAREVRESDDWFQILSRFDLDEYSIMQRFAKAARPSLRSALLDAIHGKGAFRRFRGVIYDAGIQAEWDQFRSDHIASEIRASLDVRGVPYRR